MKRKWRNDLSTQARISERSRGFDGLGAGTNGWEALAAFVPPLAGIGSKLRHYTVNDRVENIVR
jgi:hypothetical protein